MGLKDWLAKNLRGGVTSYGSVMGREAVKNGLALGRIVYVGHGIRSTPAEVVVYKDDVEMRQHGFALYCDCNVLSPVAMEDSSALSQQLWTYLHARNLESHLGQHERGRAKRGAEFKRLTACWKAQLPE